MSAPSVDSSHFESQVIEIYRSTVPGLYAAAASWTQGDRALAEDLVQESYLRALRHWRRHGIPDNPAAWLRTVARNLLVSYRRRHGRESTEAEPEAPRAGVAESLTAATDRVALADGLDEAGPQAASLLSSFHLEGLTVREIADENELTERAVEGRLRRARQALRRWFEEHDGSDRNEQ
jgi:RNA polymerase sigma-70 factor (ECF subfamily)